MVRHRGTGELIRRGTVYVFHSDVLGPDVFKIGRTTGDIEQRAKAVGGKLPGGLRQEFALPTQDCYQLESRVHRRLEKYRIRPDDPLLVYHGLGGQTEFFRGLTLDRIRRTLTSALDGLEAEDDWCRQLRNDPGKIDEIKGVGSALSPEDPDVQYWIAKLTANGSQIVTEFTLQEIAKGVKYTAKKTSYLSWRFQGKARAWFDPTYPRAASTLIHRRFDGDWDKWTSLLGEGGVFHEYRDASEICLTLWSRDHFEAMRTMTDEIMPNVNFRT